MRRTRVVIQSRLNSSRLPGKAMLTIGGMPLIELVARRAARSGHEVIVATSEERYDARIADHLESVGIPVMRGSLDDVLGRFVAATADLDPQDRVVRLTGDNPVADADLVDELLAAMDVSGHTYGRVDIEQVPEGLGAEGFTVAALREAAATTNDPYDREHVTPWLRRTLGELLFVPADCPDDIHGYRCTVDCLSDFERAAVLFSHRDDVIEVPWRTLLREIGERLESLGGTLHRDGLVAPSALLLAGSSFGRASDPSRERGAADATEVRAILATAVERGVSHVAVGRADGPSEAVLRANSEPLFTKRLGLLSRLAPLADAGSTDLPLKAQLDASLERSFAELGRRNVEVLLAASEGDALAAGYWDLLIAHRAAGLAKALGVWVEDPARLGEIISLPGVEWLVVPINLSAAQWNSPEVSAQLHAAADNGITVVASHVFAGGALVDGDTPEGGRLAGAATTLGALAPELALRWALSKPYLTSVLVGIDTDEQMAQDIDAAIAGPLDEDTVAALEAAFATS